MSYSSEVLADSPIGYWRLDETSGTNAADSSGNSHAGTYTNGPTLNQTGLLAGDADTATSFDGSNDVVIITSNAGMRVSSAWTLESWIKVASGEVIFGPILVSVYDGSTVRFMLGSWDGSNHTLKPSVGFYTGGGWRVATASSNISVNAVHHIVGTWDGTTLKVYVDGSLAGSNAPGVATPTTNTDNYYIGARWDNSGDNAHFKGIIDEVAIYGTDIGATRIAAHYTAGTTNPNGTATPSAVAGTGAVPAASASGGAIAAPSRVAGTGLIPGPTASGSGDTTAFAGAVAGVAAIPAPTAQGASLTTPARVAGTGAVPAPTVVSTATGHPAATTGVGAVPAATAFGVVNATASPGTVAGTGAVPHPHAAGVGTGGGGGSLNGVTDFWAVKALG